MVIVRGRHLILRAAITLGIGPHSSFIKFLSFFAKLTLTTEVENEDKFISVIHVVIACVLK